MAGNHQLNGATVTHWAAFGDADAEALLPLVRCLGVTTRPVSCRPDSLPGKGRVHGEVRR